MRQDGTLGGACEVLLLIDRGDNVWECLVRPGKKLRTGARVSFGAAGELTAEVTPPGDGGLGDELLGEVKVKVVCFQRNAPSNVIPVK